MSAAAGKVHQLPGQEQCPRADAWAAWKKGKLIFALTLLEAILAGIPVMAIAGDQFGLVAVFAILSLVIAAPIAAWVTFLRNRGPVCTKIDKGLTFLKIPMTVLAFNSLGDGLRDALDTK